MTPDCLTCITADTTSLSTLDEHDWQILSNRWARGIDWYTCKVGRKWSPQEPWARGFPLFTTKRDAAAAVDTLMLAESHHRHAVRHQGDA